MEDEKYIYIKYYSAEIKIKGNELIEAVKKEPIYEKIINDLKNKIYEAIKIHPSFQQFSEGDYYVLYNIEHGEPVTLYDYGKVWFKTEYGFSFNVESKQRDTIYELKNEIAEKYGIPLDHQDWTCKNIKLDDNYLTIYDYDQKNKGIIGSSIEIYIKEKPKINLYIVDGDDNNIELSIDIFDTIENLYKKAEIRIGRKIVIGQELFFYCKKYLTNNNSMIKDYNFDKNNNILQLVKCPFCIFVKTLVEKTVIIPCEPADTIAKIKEMIQENIDLPADSQRLVHMGKQLEDNKTLADYNIKNLSILHVIQRLR